MQLAPVLLPSSFNYTPPTRRTWGLGDASTQLANQLTSSAVTGASTASKTGSILTGAVQGAIGATGAILSSTALFTTAAGSAICPPCAPIFAIGALLVPVIAKVIEGCGNSCIQASDYANEIEPLLIQNLATYTNTPVGQRTASMQQAAINNFNASFSQLVSLCQSVGGQGGTNCVSDREASGCRWKATPWRWNSDGTFTPAGAAGSGSSCWNWVYGYHDPIANDPYVVPDPPTVAGAANSISAGITTLTSGTTAGVPNEYLLLGALVLVVLAVTQ